MGGGPVPGGVACGPVLAVDVGGTKLAAALVDASGHVTHAHRVPTPQGAAVDAETLWAALSALLDDVLRSAGAADDDLAGVGVGCGGPMTWPAGEVSPLNIPAWSGFPLRARLADRVPGRPVRLHNDAVCLAVGEHWRGAGRGTRSMLGMVVSTGVGGGLVVDGRLVDGRSGNAGHVGHVVVDPDGPACACGGQGCLEAVASGPGLVRWARDQDWRPGDSAGEAWTGRQLADDARGGDEVAVAALRRAGTALGVALASVVHLLDLERVVIVGGVSQAGPQLWDPLAATLRRHARLAFARDVPAVPAARGQEGGLVGAAALLLAGDSYWHENND